MPKVYIYSECVTDLQILIAKLTLLAVSVSEIWRKKSPITRPQTLGSKQIAITRPIITDGSFLNQLIGAKMPHPTIWVAAENATAA